MPKKIVEKEAMSLPELKKVLGNLKNLDESQLNAIQRKMVEYVEKFSKVPSDRASILKKKLVDKIGINEEKAVQIINIMPKTPEEIREIFHERVIIGDLAAKILDIIWSEDK